MRNGPTVLPDRARFRLLRTVVPNQITAGIDRTVRRGYETRAVTDTEGSPH